MNSISQLSITTTTAGIISEKTMDDSADILTHAQAISILQIGDTDTNDYYFGAWDSGFGVVVFKGDHGSHSVTRPPTLGSLCEVTMTPC